MQFGIFIYDGVEPIDLATVGVLSMARRIRPEIGFCTIAPTAGAVALSNGLVVLADFGVDDAPPVDVLIVTGGPGWVAQAQAPATLAFLRARAAAATIASVCTGGMIVAAAGLLEGKVATTKRAVVPPEASPLAGMRAQYPGIDVREAGLVDNGSMITGGGVSLCIDATLYLLEKFLGAECASETARIMEYTNARAANHKLFPPIILDRA
jgi:transcriptional regulator GlxA family with amidase domain